MDEFDPHITPSRYLTAEIPGTGGVLKGSDEDFIVEELPAYQPCGAGEHLYLWVQKRRMATMHVVRLLAEHFKVRRDAVGFAGLKDKMAVTTQMFSVHLPGKSEGEFGVFEQPGVAILWMDRHGNKLRRGHLAGNRFVIRVRGTNAARVVYAKKALEVLARLGVPNRIGAQRFGMVGNNHVVGRALLLRNARGVLDALLGPRDGAPENQHAARALYAEGKFDAAMTAITGGCHTERRVLSALARGASAEQAAGTIERTEHSFYVTAFQSAVFNAVLDARIERGLLAELVEGDLAFKHDSGAVFVVGAERDGLAERARAMEVSPSGPMWGREMTRAAGDVDRAEVAALEKTGVSLEVLEKLGRREVQAMVGQRRAMRVPLKFPDVEAGMDARGEYIKCVFELPRGAFATTVMQEVMKTEPTGGSGVDAPGDVDES